MSERGNAHPAPFPVLLPFRYLGSGSTAIAARLLGHHCIGIDISQEYIQLAKERLGSLQRYAAMMDEEKSRHIVRKTFQERKVNGDFTGRFKGEKNAVVPATSYLGTLF